MTKGQIAFYGLGAMLLVAGFIFYRRYDPLEVDFAPKCVFKLLTGLDCPGCGGQRALHALLNGQWRQAFLFNPFLPFTLLYAGLLALGRALPNPHNRLRQICTHRYTLSLFVVLFFTWWVVRNLIY